MLAPLLILVSVILALNVRACAANSNEIGAPIERGLDKSTNQNAQNRKHNSRPVRKKRRKGKKTEDKLQEQATSDQMHQQKVLKKVESNGGEDEKGCQQWKSK